MKQIKTINFDITSSCNSVCPNCDRFQPHDGKLYRNPGVTFDKHLSVEKIREIIFSRNVADDLNCSFVGQMGDALAHPNFLEIIGIVANKIGQSGWIFIHTNGGLRNAEWWQTFTEKLAPNNHKLWFSIDGLEDTNHIYRRGVSWSKVMQHAKIFIDGGGKAVWKFIEFPWNRHQIEEAREMSQKMGFTNFELRADRDNEEHTLKCQRAADNGILKTNAPVRDWKADIATILYPILRDDVECSPSTLNINYAGQIDPCCFFDSARTKDLYTSYYYDQVDPEHTDWNNLNVSKFDDIIANEWWSELYRTQRMTPSYLCSYACGLRG